jgi:uncharacterized coiled-coil protein SlyX
MLGLFLDDVAFQLPVQVLTQQCTLFTTDPALLASPYQVKSRVRLEIFLLFLEAVKGTSVIITNQNISDLSQLCTEFGFHGLANEISDFLSSSDFNDAHSAEGRICALEEHVLLQDRQIERLELIVNSHLPKQDQTAQALTAALARLSQVEGELVRLAKPTPKTEPPPPVLPIPKAEPPSPPPQGPSPPPLTPVKALPVSPPPPPLPRVWSLIVSDFPPLFNEFRSKKWELLWRGSRDGFGCNDFHSRCDGHANTVMLIQDFSGFVFGGFTPVKLESRVWNGKSEDESNCWKSEDSLKSFLFTLKNPHNICPRKFALKDEKKQLSIVCAPKSGPFLGDIRVSGDSNANTDSDTCLGIYYANNTGLDGKTVFTGSKNFKVNEIEVFEITD